MVAKIISFKGVTITVAAAILTAAFNIFVVSILEAVANNFSSVHILLYAAIFVSIALLFLGLLEIMIRSIPIVRKWKSSNAQNLNYGTVLEMRLLEAAWIVLVMLLSGFGIKFIWSWFYFELDHVIFTIGICLAMAYRTLHVLAGYAASLDG